MRVKQSPCGVARATYERPRPEGEAERCLRPSAAHSRPAHSALSPQNHNPAALSPPDRRKVRERPRREQGHGVPSPPAPRPHTHPHPHPHPHPMVTCCGRWSPAAEGGEEERAGGERGEESEGRDRAWLGLGLELSG